MTMRLALEDPRDTPKMLTETLAYAETYLPTSAEGRRHRERIARALVELERMRPVGPNGKHGERHTSECGCDAPVTP